MPPKIQNPQPASKRPGSPTADNRQTKLDVGTHGAKLASNSSTDARNRRPENTQAKLELEQTLGGMMFELSHDFKSMVHVAEVLKDRSELPSALFDDSKYQPILQSDLSSSNLPTQSSSRVTPDTDPNFDAIALVKDLIGLFMNTRKPGTDIQTVFAEYVSKYTDTAEGPAWFFAKDIVERWEPHVWILITAGATDDLLQNLPESPRESQKAIYGAIVLVKALTKFGEHFKMYAGLAGLGLMDLKERIRSHENPGHREDNPCELHTMMDLPGSKTKWVTLALYPDSASRGELLMGEGVIVGALGLFESVSLYEQLAAIKIPICQTGLRSPSFGLNGELSLRYGIDSDSHKNIDFKNRCRKLIKLITTGVVVTWGSEIKIGIVEQRKVTIGQWYTKKYPELSTSNAGVLVVSITPGRKHPHPYLQWKAGGLRVDDTPSELQRFGMWLRLPRSGFWIMAKEQMHTKTRIAVNREKAFELAKAMTGYYGL